MAVDQSLVGKSFAPTNPYLVTEWKRIEFAQATHHLVTPERNFPPTFPIVLTFGAMFGALEEIGIDLARVIHGDQKFHYERPIAVGDELVATLSVTSLRQIAGNDIIGLASAITDPTGELVCTATSTIIHRGEAA
jgi:hypothetical protein